MSFGPGMQGLGEQILEIVREVHGKFSPMTYLELGVAKGETLCEVSKCLRGNGNKGWRAIGVESAHGDQGDSFDKSQVEQNFNGQHLTVAFIKPNGWAQISPVWNRTTVVMADSADFFEGMWQDPIHLALIDACHCKECAMRDFLNVEKYIVPGGTVLFHDFEPGMHCIQRKNHGYTDVPGACKELGIMDKRDGWALPRVMAADHSAGGGNMLAVTKL